ncbi:hypothetical protein JG687_00015605 [Phytophthora cactorum]|uniref:Uncharacterized protein n=1 Tax=Phytophthora cactorum TaxID=29920 RepID=A0A8T1TWH2_9STRA|nr:hypothetical protein JG687_00015605 [Phytophthora cactorum]
MATHVEARLLQAFKAFVVTPWGRGRRSFRPPLQNLLHCSTYLQPQQSAVSSHAARHRIAHLDRWQGVRRHNLRCVLLRRRLHVQLELAPRGLGLAHPGAPFSAAGSNHASCIY